MSSYKRSRNQESETRTSNGEGYIQRMFLGPLFVADLTSPPLQKKKNKQRNCAPPPFFWYVTSNVLAFLPLNPKDLRIQLSLKT